MSKPTHGRAGREGRKTDQRDTYDNDLGNLLAKQLRPQPTTHLLHLGGPGAIPLISELAPRMQAGSVSVLVYTFDELAETTAALEQFPHVSVVNEFDDLPNDTQFDIATTIVPYHLGIDYVAKLITTAFERLKRSGVFFYAGDRRRDWERYLVLLNSLASPVTSVANSAHLRIVQAEATAGRRRGGIVRKI